MAGSMRTFVTDGQTDGRTDGADYIGPRWLRGNAFKNQKDIKKVESWGSSDLFGLVICWRYS